MDDIKNPYFYYRINDVILQESIMNIKNKNPFLRPAEDELAAAGDEEQIPRKRP
jgi:hypothetical protein